MSRVKAKYCCGYRMRNDVKDYCVFFVPEVEMRPLLCQCVILTSGLHEDCSETFLLLTSSLTSCFPVSPASAKSAVNTATSSTTHTDDFNQEQAKSNTPLTVKISYNMLLLYTSCIFWASVRHLNKDMLLL